MKNHASDFFRKLFCLWQNLPKWDFANQSKMITKIHWHDFSCINAPLFDFLGWNFFGPKFGQVWPNLDQFLGPNFFSFRVKKAFVNMNWIPKCAIFISASSKVIQPCAFRPSKANVSLTLQPLKLPIGQNVPQTILYGFQVLFLTYL